MQVNYNYTPPAFLNPKEEEPKPIPVQYDAEKYPDSSNKLMCLQEVMDYFGVQRTTISQWRKMRDFPEPISRNPMRFLRESVAEWESYVGGFRAGSKT